MKSRIVRHRNGMIDIICKISDSLIVKSIQVNVPEGDSIYMRAAAWQRAGPLWCQHPPEEGPSQTPSGSASVPGKAPQDGVSDGALSLTGWSGCNSRLCVLAKRSPCHFSPLGNEPEKKSIPLPFFQINIKKCRKVYLFWGWECGILSKVTPCTAGILCGCRLWSWQAHFECSFLLLAWEKQWKITQVLGALLLIKETQTRPWLLKLFGENLSLTFSNKS